MRAYEIIMEGTSLNGWPLTVDDIFQAAMRGDVYQLSTSDLGSAEGDMDNKEAMAYFLNMANVTTENILIDDGTQVLLRHQMHNHNVRIDSGGDGDFYSHIFELTMEPK